MYIVTSCVSKFKNDIEHMDEKLQFDFHYAVANTNVVHLPENRLETFGNTHFNYRLISELMDSVDRIRIREGVIKAHRPEIITPDSMEQNPFEGFGNEAAKYHQWLQQHEQELMLLRYGFTVEKSETNEHLVTDTLSNVAERVIQEVRQAHEAATAVLIGVDKPWEVCLLKLMVDVIQQSVVGNVRDIQQDRALLSGHTTPDQVRLDIEEEFRLAATHPGRLNQLGQMLHQKGLFKEYEDRFFTLLRKHAS